MNKCENLTKIINLIKLVSIVTHEHRSKYWIHWYTWLVSIANHSSTRCIKSNKVHFSRIPIRNKTIDQSAVAAEKCFWPECVSRACRSRQVVWPVCHRIPQSHFDEVETSWALINSAKEYLGVSNFEMGITKLVYRGDVLAVCISNTWRHNLFSYVGSALRWKLAKQNISCAIA